MRAALVVCVVATACGGPEPSPAEQRTAQAGTKPVEAAVIASAADLAARPLGLADVAAFDWRKRGGQPHYVTALEAEKHGNWGAVADACKAALAADPDHLDAAWLDAIALGKLGKTGDIVAPLQVAVAGDFGKWGDASLAHPALAVFLATPTGAAWRRRVEQDRAAYVAALARSLLVGGGGNLYAYDAQGPRWYRLTRTSGSVLGALRVPAAQRIVYVARQRLRGKDWHLAVGTIDLARGTTLRAVDAGTRGPLTVAYSASKPTAGVWLATNRKGPWRRIDDTGELVALPPSSARPPGAWLEARSRSVRVHALPAGVIADWDDKGLASAIRIAKSNRVISVASPGLIDGNTAQWSPDRSQLAFVAQLDEQCEPGARNAAAFIADAATGSTRELERATGGLSVEWLSDQKLALAGDHGVSIVALSSGSTPAPLAGAEQLAIPRHRPRCTPPEPADDTPPDEDPSDSPDPSKN